MRIPGDNPDGEGAVLSVLEFNNSLDSTLLPEVQMLLSQLGRRRLTQQGDISPISGRSHAA